jgi:hypothetical protein
MNTRSITRIGLVLLGVYFALAAPVTTLASVVGAAFATRDTELAGMLGLSEMISMIPLLLLASAPGVLVIAISRPLAARLCPEVEGEGAGALASGDLARLGLRLLALYFVIEGLLSLLEAGLFQATLDGSALPAQFMARGVAHVLIGGLVLSLAPGLARRLDR